MRVDQEVRVTGAVLAGAAAGTWRSACTPVAAGRGDEGLGAVSSG